MENVSLQDLSGLLDTLCPMHLVLDSDGIIVGAGPTLLKLRPDHALVGQPLLTRFELTRPRLTSLGALWDRQGKKLHLQFRDAPQTALKGVLMRCGPVWVLNLSFGISVLDSIRDYDLTNADFAATDLIIEMLYLIEAKSAAMEASRKLNMRLQGAKIAAEEQAFTDTLTGLKNRRAMDHVLTRLIGVGQVFALMHVDLDFFKQVNDTMGHAAGDHVLQRAAMIMVEEVRKDDTVARVGGDEFVLILRGIQNRETLSRIAARLIDRLEQPVPYEGKECRISASLGIVLSVDYDTPSPRQMLEDADQALYASKRRGRACHSFHVE
ncbi:diguanylate cyclase [Thalassobius vesicularis]|uniref:Diguanylate cyclase n=1 Tax=Thalassobius vesicularis TaxID=1294297 RepID=A0A4S3MB28_9RHOB|nr:GGDEF domain-containing protein [Thalassobius vesicularis]THD75674.1 diguanylate cyclase [Thalassobius vesicularis]